MLVKRKKSTATYHNFYSPTLRGDVKRFVKERFVRVQ